MGIETRRSWLWLVPLIFIVTALGASRLNADILFVDEYWSIRNSGGDPFGPLGFLGIWERTATVDPGGMGVLYHWLLAVWGALVGSSPYAIRAFSLLAGVLAIAGTYRLGTDLFSRRVGLYAAFVLGTSAFFIDYLHEGRAYTLIALWAVLAIDAYQRARSEQGRAVFIWLLLLTHSLAALAYTHYVALAIGAALGLYHFLSFHNGRRWWLIFGAMALAGLLFLPWLGVTLEVIDRGAGDTVRQEEAMTGGRILQDLPQALSNANIALLALLTLYSLREFDRRKLLLWCWLLVCLALVLVVNALIPFMLHLRYLMLIWPAAALIVALGMAQMQGAGIAISAILLVWGGAGIYQSANPAFIDAQFGQVHRASAAEFHAARAILNERGAEGDMALFHIIPPGFEHLNYFVLGYYMDETPFTYDQIERMNNSFAGGDNDYLRDVQIALGEAQAVWTIRNTALETTQRSNVVDFVLRSFYAECGDIYEQASMQMTLYAAPPQSAPVAAFRHDEDALIGLHNLQRSQRTAETWRTVLAWDIPANIPADTYSISLYLTDEAGQRVTQIDVPLPNQRPFACTELALPVRDLNSGMYTAQLVVYNWQTGERLMSGTQDSATLDALSIP